MVRFGAAICYSEMGGVILLHRLCIISGLSGLLIVFLLTSSFRYQSAVAHREFSFPRDHFAHPEFRTEWWYYTGHLETEGGRSYGYQVTFFRFGLRDRQAEEDTAPLFTDLYMAHFALSDKMAKKFIFRDRINRGYGGKAGARVDRYLVWNEDWRVELRGENHEIEIKDRSRVLKLQLTPMKPPVFHGRKGKGEGRASYYYSLTRMSTQGTIELGGRTERVRGLSWMDHEFGSDQLGRNQVGWDWFSLQLENKTELMLYLMRRKDGSVDPVSSGTLVYEDGTTRNLSLDSFRIEVVNRWTSPQSGADYPMGWKIEIPSERIELDITPFFAQQELDTLRSTRVVYWEGSVRVQGSSANQPVRGVGYVEMTGYAGPLRF